MLDAATMTKFDTLVAQAVREMEGPMHTLVVRLAGEDVPCTLIDLRRVIDPETGSDVSRATVRIHAPVTLTVPVKTTFPAESEIEVAMSRLFVQP